MSEKHVSNEFVAYSARKLSDHLAQVRRCVALLSEEQAWYRPNDRSNSVANLLLHLTGNIRQWIIGGIAGRPIQRNRQGEFDARNSVSKEQAFAELESTVADACEVIRCTDTDALQKSFEIQAYRLTGVAAILHVVEHFAFHAGQIVTTTKWLLDVDLSLYDEKGHRRDGREEGIP